MEPTLAEVRMFGGNFAPRAWALCQGQLLPIGQNQALFSLLGTTYGGDGRSTFGLPDCRGRRVIGQGNGAGLSSRALGAKGGQETVVLNTSQIPSHTHTTTGNLKASNAPANSDDPKGRAFGVLPTGSKFYAADSGSADHLMAEGSIQATIGNTGGNLAHTNQDPFVVVNFIIALQGVFPSRS